MKRIQIRIKGNEEAGKLIAVVLDFENELQSEITVEEDKAYISIMYENVLPRAVTEALSKCKIYAMSNVQREWNAVNAKDESVGKMQIPMQERNPHAEGKPDDNASNGNESEGKTGKKTGKRVKKEETNKSQKPDKGKDSRYPKAKESQKFMDAIATSDSLESDIERISQSPKMQKVKGILRDTIQKIVEVGIDIINTKLTWRMLTQAGIELPENARQFIGQVMSEEFDMRTITVISALAKREMERRRQITDKDGENQTDSVQDSETNTENENKAASEGDSGEETYSKSDTTDSAGVSDMRRKIVDSLREYGLEDESEETKEFLISVCERAVMLDSMENYKEIFEGDTPIEKAKQELKFSEFINRRRETAIPVKDFFDKLKK